MAITTDVPTRSDDVPPARVFRRAKPIDAVDLALDTFGREARVDMQVLAAELDVSPATLYRWFGSRAQLLDQVCGHLAEAFTAAARDEARGEGDERVCDYARRAMTTSSSFAPIRSFVGREPQLALRLLLGKDGAVQRVVTEQTRALIADTRSADEADQLERPIHLMVQTATALVWATFMVGDEPEIDSAVEIIRMVLASSHAAG